MNLDALLVGELAKLEEASLRRSLRTAETIILD
jgi:hypothetical protein